MRVTITWTTEGTSRRVREVGTKTVVRNRLNVRIEQWSLDKYSKYGREE